VAGIEAGDWFRMYLHTHDGTRRIEWPAGGEYLNQLAVVPEVWEVLGDEIRQYRKEKGAS